MKATAALFLSFLLMPSQGFQVSRCRRTPTLLLAASNNKEDADAEELKKRIAEVKQKETTLPILVTEPILPGEELCYVIPTQGNRPFWTWMKEHIEEGDNPRGFGSLCLEGRTETGFSFHQRGTMLKVASVKETTLEGGTQQQALEVTFRALNQHFVTGGQERPPLQRRFEYTAASGTSTSSSEGGPPTTYFVEGQADLEEEEEGGRNINPLERLRPRTFLLPWAVGIWIQHMYERNPQWLENNMERLGPIPSPTKQVADWLMWAAAFLTAACCQDSSPLQSSQDMRRIRIELLYAKTPRDLNKVVWKIFVLALKGELKREGLGKNDYRSYITLLGRCVEKLPPPLPTINWGFDDVSGKFEYIWDKIPAEDLYEDWWDCKSEQKSGSKRKRLCSFLQKRWTKARGRIARLGPRQRIADHWKWIVIAACGYDCFVCGTEVLSVGTAVNAILWSTGLKMLGKKKKKDDPEADIAVEEHTRVTPSGEASLVPEEDVYGEFE